MAAKETKKGSFKAFNLFYRFRIFFSLFLNEKCHLSFTALALLVPMLKLSLNLLRICRENASHHVVDMISLSERYLKAKKSLVLIKRNTQTFLSMNHA
jgi:hypothetical protein